MWKVYLGLVGQSFGKRILINLNMYTVKLKFLRRETVLRQILKPTKKNKKTDVAIKYVAAAQYPEEGVN